MSLDYFVFTHVTELDLSRYQCAFPTFSQAGYTSEDAKRIMRKAVRLAVEARDRFLREPGEGANHDDNEHPRRRTRDIKISLSLGPFGATLSPAQEFDGFYPPPFGPRAYSPLGDNTNAFDASEDPTEARRSAIESLTMFHLERLAVFAEEENLTSEGMGVWDAIDVIAFETIPLTTEIIAIRRAMSRLYRNFPALKRKLWWISTVYLRGQFPEQVASGGVRKRVSVREVTRALYGSDVDVEQVSDANHDYTLALPTGIGINCTSIDGVQNILTEMTSTMQELRRLRHDQLLLSAAEAPLLVVYPNRGDIYDIVTRTWVPAEYTGEGWAKRLCDVVFPLLHENGTAWRGTILGGCCKAGPAEIAALVKQVKNTTSEMQVQLGDATCI